MGKLLALWIEYQNQRNLPVNLGIIETKTKSLYDDPKAEEEGNWKEK